MSKNSKPLHQTGSVSLYPDDWLFIETVSQTLNIGNKSASLRYILQFARDNGLLPNTLAPQPVQPSTGE